MRIAAVVRLIHPFPSILDGLVVSAVAMVAGAAPGVALQLGASMTALQASIGALNDVHDAPEEPITIGSLVVRASPPLAVSVRPGMADRRAFASPCPTA